MSDTPSSSVPIEIVPQVVRLLSNLSPDDRSRVVSAALILLGDQPVSGSLPKSRAGNILSDESSDGMSAKGIAWLQRNGFEREQIDHVFQVSSNDVEVIAATMPSRGRRLQTVDCYVLSGLRSLLKGTDGAFQDREARELCQKIGCYDVDNHSSYIKGFGNYLTGSKDAGWRLTNPGGARAAEIVRQISQGTQ